MKTRRPQPPRTVTPARPALRMDFNFHGPEAPEPWENEDLRKEAQAFAAQTFAAHVPLPLAWQLFMLHHADSPTLCCRGADAIQSA
jgi:hypothetical protein